MAGGGVPLHFGAQRGGQDADGHQCASGLQQNAVGYVQGTAVRFQVQSAGGCGQVQTGPPDCGATPLPGYGGVLQEGLGHWAQGYVSCVLADGGICGHGSSIHRYRRACGQGGVGGQRQTQCESGQKAFHREILRRSFCNRIVTNLALTGKSQSFPAEDRQRGKGGGTRVVRI